MSEPAALTVVVVNWNSGVDDLPRCLASLRRQSLRPRHVVVVDNASVDGSAARAAQEFNEFEFLRLDRNLGFAGGANAGIARRHADDAVLVLNPDAWLAADFVERALAALTRAGAGFVAPKVLRADAVTLDTTGQFLSPWLRRVIERGYGAIDRGQYEEPGPVPSVCGAVALYGPSLLARLAPDGRLYDEDFFAFWEDADVGARAGRAGLRGWYEPTAVAFHRRGGTRPRTRRVLGRVVQILGRDPEVQYHILKNRYLFLVKNEPLGSLLLRLPLFAVVDGAVLIATAVLRPRVFLRLLRMAPLLARAWRARRA